MKGNDYSKTQELVLNGQRDGIYPGAVLSTGDGESELFRMYCGYRSIYPEKADMCENTLFDIASMTKIMSTSMIALKLIETGRLNLTDKLGTYFDCPPDKKDITIKNLMTHTAGLPAHIDLYEKTNDPKKVMDVILGLDLLYLPNTEVTYSCLGFITLANIIQNICGSDLNKLAHEMVFNPLGMKNTTYNPEPNDNIASTEIMTTKFDGLENVYLKGKVHDENARFIGGISGNAGIFSNIEDCSIFARMLSNKGIHNGKEFINRDLFDDAITNHTPTLSEGRGLGFVVKKGLPSSAGKIFSDGSYGHTGFTGTSVWVNLETSQYVVFLTNRVHPSRENVKLVTFRKEVHDSCAIDYKN